MPFTPINALPQEIQTDVIVMVQQQFSSNPMLTQICDPTLVPLMLNDTQFNALVLHLLGVTSKQALQNELQQLQTSGQPMFGEDQQGGPVGGVQPNEQAGGGMGANAVQPKQQQLQQGSTNVQ
ncbi:hypothetical protein Zmor_016427 [Zophobas morio]|uniref:Uncharacterized protein n=1 Tax=Zophobas morio TaxID=2755281 RepID=A0AA38HLE9_9CUCU|nr:hypothetical protein Zmor_016427 [Zophobas morio]